MGKAAIKGELSELALTVRGWREALTMDMLPDHAQVLGRDPKDIPRQEDIARAVCASLVVVARLERHREGETITMQSTVLDSIAKVLCLNSFQRRFLHVQVYGREPVGGWADEAAHVSEEMIRIVHRSNEPAYISDVAWDVIAYNDHLVKVMPWLAREGANVMLDTFLHPNARASLVDFDTVWAPPMVYAMRTALPYHPGNQRLIEVTGRVRAESALAQSLWAMPLDINGHTMGARRATIVNGEVVDITVTAMSRYATHGARVMYLMPIAT